MKLDKKFLVAGAVLLLVIVLAVAFVFVKKSASVNGEAENNKQGSGAANARAYISEQSPSAGIQDMVLGSDKAELKIFVYEDYNSIYSATLADTLTRIQAEAGDRLALIIRPYFKNSADGRTAALALDCARRQDKWKEMRALLFARAKNQQAGNLDLFAYARQIGLGEDNFQNCLTNSEKSGTIEQSARATEELGVQGAPTMFIGDEVILGARPYDDFTDSNGDKIAGLKRVIEEKLK